MSHGEGTSHVRKEEEGRARRGSVRWRIQESTRIVGWGWTRSGGKERRAITPACGSRKGKAACGSRKIATGSGWRSDAGTADRNGASGRDGPSGALDRTREGGGTERASGCASARRERAAEQATKSDARAGEAPAVRDGGRRRTRRRPHGSRIGGACGRDKTRVVPAVRGIGGREDRVLGHWERGKMHCMGQWQRGRG